MGQKWILKKARAVKFLTGLIKKENMEEKKIETIYKKLEEEDIKWEYFRASGPGGQKVNKTSSGVRLRLLLTESANFTDDKKELIKMAYPHKITAEGDFIVESTNSRSQKINKNYCLEKAELMINRALAPKPARIETKMPESQKEERLRLKELTSKKKRMRKKVDANKEF